MNIENKTKETLLKEIEGLRKELATFKNTPVDLKREYGELMATQAFQQSILDGVADPIMVIDQEYNVKLMNRAAREFSSENDIPAQSMRCYQISHQRDTPCDGVEHPCPLEQACETRQQVTVLHEHYMANGENRLLEIIAAPFWGPDCTFQGIVESMRDVTERTRAEKELRIQTDQIRALAAQFTEVTEAERQRLARDLHDLVGQNLSALAINLNIIQTQLQGVAGDLICVRIEDSISLVEETTERIRDVMTRLRPPILDDCGLVAALHWYGEKFTRRTGVPVAVECEDPEPRLIARVENALFRIYQEALTNVAKHAQATKVTVNVDVDARMSRLVIADDGIGFVSVPVIELDEARGWGLLTMKERAEAVGGHCRVESAPNQGTKVIVEVSR